MRDVIFLLLVVGFFALAIAYVRGCAAVVAQDLADAAPPTDVDRADESGATV